MYDIVAKLGQPCIFIRYNPDNKSSDKTYLLKRIKYYLDFEKIYDENIFVKMNIDPITCFYVEYLFY